MKQDSLINVVYRPLGTTTLPPIRVEGYSCSIIWSGIALPDASAYFCMNSDAFPKEVHLDGKLCMLYLSEPLCVYPSQYTRHAWNQFDFVFTWNPYFSHPRFINCLRPFSGYQMPVQWNQGDPVSESSEEALKRRKAICMINNDKRSAITGELYSMRKEMALWFHQDRRIPFDVFAQQPFPVPNYLGQAADGKIQTLRKYRYALCFENLYHPIWSRGYLTEKVFDALYSLTVPIYFGCSDIDKYLPSNCFIDYRKFSGPEQLRSFLENMSDVEYLTYVESIQRFIGETQPLQRYHWSRVYERIFQLMTQLDEDPTMTYRARSLPLPRSYTMTERDPIALVRFHMQCVAMTSPRLVAVYKKIISVMAIFHPKRKR